MLASPFFCCGTSACLQNADCVRRGVKSSICVIIIAHDLINRVLNDSVSSSHWPFFIRLGGKCIMPLLSISWMTKSYDSQEGKNRWILFVELHMMESRFYDELPIFHDNFRATGHNVSTIVCGEVYLFIRRRSYVVL